MFRVGKQPVAIPGGVSVDVAADRTVTVKGPKGSLQISLRPEIDVAVDSSVATIEPNGTGPERQSRAFHGLTRALINNMVEGVSKGFEKRLEIIGVGWNAAVQGKQLVLNIVRVSFFLARPFPWPVGGGVGGGVGPPVSCST